METPHRPLRVVFRTVTLLVIAAAILLLLAQGAFAHAVLISSSPGQGERLASAPTEFRLRFSEPVAHVATSLVVRDGSAADLSATVSGADVRVVAGPLDEGVYALNWRVVSEDGHPVSASIVFSVGQSDATAPLPSSSASRNLWPTALSWVAKLIFYASCLFGVGGIFFACNVELRPPGRACLGMVLIGCASAGLSLGLTGVELTGSPLSSIVGADIWLAAFDSSLGRSVAVSVISLAMASVAVLRPSLGRGFSLVALALLGSALALTGHASDAGVKWLSSGAVAVHVMTAAFWAGALPRLRSLLVAGRMQNTVALARFSSAIPLSVAALVVAGTYLACVQLGSVRALWETAYGNVLAAKLALIGTALAIGGWNRIFLTRRVLGGDCAATSSMKRLVTVEIALIAIALSVTAMWRFTPPPRVLALQVPVLSSAHIHGTAAMATVTFETTSDLRFDAEVFLQTAGFDELDAKEVKLRMSAVDGSVSAFDVPLQRAAPGLWRAGGVQAPCDCDWKIRIEALVSDFDLATLTGETRLLNGNKDIQPFK